MTTALAGAAPARAALAGGALAALLLVAGCASGSSDEAPATGDHVESGSRVETISYAGGRELDLYLPGGPSPAPVVLVVHGVTPDPDPKSFQGFVDWGERLSAAGLAVVVPNLEVDPLGGGRARLDLEQVHQRLTEDAERLGLDLDRIGVLGFSAGGRTAVEAAFDAPWGPADALALYYAVLEPLDSGAAPTTSLAGRAEADDVPVQLAVGANDSVPGVRESLEVFLETAGPERAGVLEHPTGEHAFDAFQDDETTRSITALTVDFLTESLGSQPD